MLRLILIVIAAVFFAFDFFRVTLTPRWTPSWTPGGFCLLTIALFLM